MLASGFFWCILLLMTTRNKDDSKRLQVSQGNTQQDFMRFLY